MFLAVGARVSVGRFIAIDAAKIGSVFHAHNETSMGGATSFFGVVLSGGANVAIGFKGRRRPLSPDPAHGLVVPFPDHLTNHYVTKAFDFWATVAAGAQGVFMFWLGLVVISILVKKNR